MRTRPARQRGRGGVHSGRGPWTPSGLNLPVAGSYTSAEATITLEPFSPPVTRTRPSDSRVAVWTLRPVVIEPVALKPAGPCVGAPVGWAVGSTAGVPAFGEPVDDDQYHGGRGATLRRRRTQAASRTAIDDCDEAHRPEAGQAAPAGTPPRPGSRGGAISTARSRMPTASGRTCRRASGR